MVSVRDHKRRLRAAEHRASILVQASGIPHTVKHDGRGFYYPIPCGAGAKKQPKNTSAELRTKVVLQRITFGRPKRKRTIRYTTVVDWAGRHPKLSRRGKKLES